MPMQYRVRERLQLSGFVIFLFTMFGPMAAIIIIGNLYPERMSTPIAVTVIISAIIISVTVVAIRNRDRILTIDGSRWTLRHKKTGRLITEIDLSLPFSMAFAIRQGLIGKSARTMRRWLQVFILQGGNQLFLESQCRESVNLKGNIQSDWLEQIPRISDSILILAAEKKYCYNEPEYLRVEGKPGSAIYGLPSFHDTDDVALLKIALNASEDYTGLNRFIPHCYELDRPGIKFSIFKKAFTRSSRDST